jgi:two-component system NtrC family sensor kinase
MKIKVNLKTKLISSFVAIVLIIGVSSILIGIKIINDNVIGQAYDDVQTNLNTIKYLLDERIRFKMRFLEYLSYLETIRSSIAVNNRRMIAEKLREVKLEVEFDILTVTDARGQVIVRSGNFNMFGDDVSRDIYVGQVLKTGKNCFGWDIISRDNLLKEGRGLADRALINVIPTPRARKKNRKVEDRALVLKAAAPVVQNGSVIGVIYGAKLINNSFDLVDKFKSLVFKDEIVDGSDLGTATFFLDDLRVSTNVRRQDGMRAVGTQVSEEVYRQVFEKGKT